MCRAPKGGLLLAESGRRQRPFALQVPHARIYRVTHDKQHTHQQQRHDDNQRRRCTAHRVPRGYAAGGLFV
jgi:hypothetical protein